MIIFIFLCIIIATLFILIGILGSSKISAKKILPFQDEDQIKKIKKRSALASIFPFSHKLLEKLNLDGKIKNKLDAAHVQLTPQEFFNLKLILMLFFGVVSIFSLGKFEPWVFLVALALGYILIDLWLKRKIGQRKFAIARLLPETVDLLGLCVEGGLDFTSAVRWIIEKTAQTAPNPMNEELAFVLEEVKWGKPRSQALKDMAKRLNIPEVSSFVQALVQAERMGTPVSETFTIISEDTRLQRFRRGERYALQASIKILIPLIFCILPLIGIVIGGPILLQFIQGGLFKGVGQ